MYHSSTHWRHVIDVRNADCDATRTLRKETKEIRILSEQQMTNFNGRFHLIPKKVDLVRYTANIVIYSGTSYRIGRWCSAVDSDHCDDVGRSNLVV